MLEHKKGVGYDCRAGSVFRFDMLRSRMDRTRNPACDMQRNTLDPAYMANHDNRLILQRDTHLPNRK
jgi:hypothetical protein